MIDKVEPVSLEHFLNSVSVLVKKNEEISRLRQESFNIFSVLRKEDDEVRLHSAFITVLLNPNGSHEKGSKFCQLFFEAVGLEIDNSEVFNVRSEASASEYGRVDILLESAKTIVVIENKISARDQNQQLERYEKFAMSNGKQFHILYLTLDGKRAENHSTADGTVKYKPISYEDEILNWLKSCLKESVDHPTLRETIRQYITLVKKLTSKLSAEMEEEMEDLIIKNFRAARFVASNLGGAIDKMARSFLEKLETELVKEIQSDTDLKDQGQWTVTVIDTVTQKWKSKVKVENSEWFDGALSFGGHPFISPDSESILGFEVKDLKSFREKLDPIMKTYSTEFGMFTENQNYGYYQLVTRGHTEKIFYDKNHHTHIAGVMINLIKECSVNLRK